MKFMIFCLLVGVTEGSSIAMRCLGTWFGVGVQCMNGGA